MFGERGGPAAAVLVAATGWAHCSLGAWRPPNGDRTLVVIWSPWQRRAIIGSKLPLAPGQARRQHNAIVPINRTISIVPHHHHVRMLKLHTSTTATTTTAKHNSKIDHNNIYYLHRRLQPSQTQFLRQMSNAAAYSFFVASIRTLLLHSPQASTQNMLDFLFPPHLVGKPLNLSHAHPFPIVS